MRVFGTPLSGAATRVLLLGAGELGKEVVIELQRLGVETIAVDRYANAPAMQLAHRSHVIDMLDGDELRRVIELEKPALIVPEIEAIHTPTLQALEGEGYTVIPTARAARLTMDREGIRRLAAEALGLPTSPYRFAGSLEEYRAAVDALGMPCVVKPVMSSSGKGQSVVKTAADVQKAWDYAQSGGRASPGFAGTARTATERAAGDGSGRLELGRVIVEGFVPFDYEITLLTVKHAGAPGEPDRISFCPPIGHLQIDGDYRESWQPQAMSATVLEQSRRIAAKVVEALCAPAGRGLFGVELFVRGDEAIFSEVSPRPHDTGLVTLATQVLSEFALHARAILGLPVDTSLREPGASAVIYGGMEAVGVAYEGVAEALTVPGADLRLFGKPEAFERRRMGVALARWSTVEEARARALEAARRVRVVKD